MILQDIEKVSSVKEALDQLVVREGLEGVTSTKTNQETEAYQTVTIEELPFVLLLHLKCFDYKSHSCHKIQKALDFPVLLSLEPRLLSSGKNKKLSGGPPNGPKNKQYKLFAVVYHDGKEASKGHYITDVFHVGYSGWIRYDDANVRFVMEQEVLHPRPPRVPYILYYRRADTIGK
ncbi:ubiquitin carboxyl-terminal hydrolase 10-like [Diaphorina citri]|uniref:ubiquitinyl hydrolase 1 n=2 Tax=Diaphorina citri TaxID=121845 RepID=A0A3Q0JJZ3_DIACI|nr:ubiquitin carboxyl-terminal hydrolase 10-like [Diaphorina citri]